MSTNAFEIRDQLRQQNLKERPEPRPDFQQELAPVPTKKEPIVDQLPTARKKGKAYNLYIDREVMERVTALSTSRGVSVSSMVSALLRIALEQMEG